MKGSEYNKLFEASLRRKLTAAEEASLQAYFIEHPEAQAGWEEETQLTHLIARLPDVPLPSNFTAQVLELVERESSGNTAPRRAPWWVRLVGTRLAPKFASVFALLAALVALFYHQHRVAVREEVAQSVAAVSDLVAVFIGPQSSQVESPSAMVANVSSATDLPTLEMLEDFEVIKRLNQVPREADVELLAALEPSFRF